MARFQNLRDEGEFALTLQHEQLVRRGLEACPNSSRCLAPRTYGAISNR